MADTTRQLSQRLYEIADEMGLGPSQLASALGYPRLQSMTRVRNGTSFIGPERIVKLAKMRDSSGLRPNLEYLFTGRGRPLLAEGCADAFLGRLAALSPDKRKMDAICILLEGK